MEFYLIMRVLGEVKLCNKKNFNWIVKNKIRNTKKIDTGNLCKKRLGSCKRLCRSSVVNLATKAPDDYVIASGKNYSVKQFIIEAAKVLKMRLLWKGKGIKQKHITMENV